MIHNHIAQLAMFLCMLIFNFLERSLEDKSELNNNMNFLQISRIRVKNVYLLMLLAMIVSSNPCTSPWGNLSNAISSFNPCTHGTGVTDILHHVAFMKMGHFWPIPTSTQLSISIFIDLTKQLHGLWNLEVQCRIRKGSQIITTLSDLKRKI